LFKGSLAEISEKPPITKTDSLKKLEAKLKSKDAKELERIASIMR
jgi:hypothetical protein